MPLTDIIDGETLLESIKQVNISYTLNYAMYIYVIYIFYIKMMNSGALDEGEISTVLDDKVLTPSEKFDIACTYKNTDSVGSVISIII